jgi:hypothetical protein
MFQRLAAAFLESLDGISVGYRFPCLARFNDI